MKRLWRQYAAWVTGLQPDDPDLSEVFRAALSARWSRLTGKRTGND